jgi:cytochrome c-type biogenesis protein CcmE
LPVSYVGSDPLPDTFIDKSQALVEGSLERNGNFTAQQVQAKCASKYEAAPGAEPPAKTAGAAADSTPRSSM